MKGSNRPKKREQEGEDILRESAWKIYIIYIYVIYTNESQNESYECVNMRLFSRKSEVNSFVIFSCMMLTSYCHSWKDLSRRSSVSNFTDPGDLLIHVRKLIQ